MEDNKFTQLCVWEGTTLGKGTHHDLARFILEELGAQIKFDSVQLTLPTPGDPESGGRSDIFFYMHSEDVGKCAMLRLQYGIRWWEDVISNGGGYLYSEEFRETHPTTW